MHQLPLHQLSIDRDRDAFGLQRRILEFFAQLPVGAAQHAHEMHAMYDVRVTTAKARAAFHSKFEREVDPDGVLSPEERGRRAEAARKAHFARLAFLSAKARAKRVHHGGG